MSTHDIETLEIEEEAQFNDEEPYQIEPRVEEREIKDLEGHLPFLKKCNKIKGVMVEFHRMNYENVNTQKCSSGCLFCIYHVDNMLKRKSSSPHERSVCLETNVQFFVYCIDCDQIWISFTEIEFKYVSFGFIGYSKCISENRHNKRNLRYMMINCLDQREEMSMFRPITKLNECDLESEILPDNLTSKDTLKYYHYVEKFVMLDFSEPKDNFLDTYHNIIYVIRCNICEKSYVGKTTKSFYDRYEQIKKILNIKLIKEHFGQTNCTPRDIRWTVLDTLSEDQKKFLRHWEDIFCQCDVNDKQILWELMNSSQTDKLIDIVWKNNDTNEAIGDIKKLRQGVRESEIAHVKWKPGDESKDHYLEKESRKWIEKTQDLFLEDSEQFWMNTLKTNKDHGGFNYKAAERSHQIFPNFYNCFFRKLGYRESILHNNL